MADEQQNQNIIPAGQEPSMEVGMNDVPQGISDVPQTTKATDKPAEQVSEVKSDTTESETPSVENEEKLEVKEGEEPTVAPTPEVKEDAKENEKTDVETKEDTSESEKANEKADESGENNSVPTETPTDELVEDENKEQVDTEQDKLRAEIEELRAAEEERQEVNELSNLVQTLDAGYTKVLDGIQKAVNDTLDQYGIDKTKTLEEIRKEDPAKAAIAEDIIRAANQVKDVNEREANKQITDKQNHIIFKKAEKLFNKYNLTQEQGQVAADTFVQIMLSVGVNDLQSDLEAKVELAAAKGKMIHPDVVKEPVKEEIKEPVEKPTEPQTEPPTEAPKQPDKKVTTEKPSLNALKEGVTEGVSAANNSSPVTVDNVLQLLVAQPSKLRTTFYEQHEALINEAGRRRSK